MTNESDAGQNKAAAPTKQKVFDAVDPSVKVISALLALIIPSVAAFFAFTYAVDKLQHDTDTKTCELTIKVGIARAISDYMEAVGREKELLANPNESDTDDVRKQKDEAIQKIKEDKKRAVEKRKLYEAAEKNIWKGNCSELEAKVQQL